ncbi:MAG: collagenase [Chlamydiae bacterium RIFCSPHIGHO2_12_FULL_27_8]|nr:MAG: collagenase [Chlamydiae bacterium RIFCSPHIGHO2_12_FULL_27_8]
MYPKILSPAGNYESLLAAIDAKADCIYFGIDELNMRKGAIKSFKLNDLNDISKICKKNNIKCFLTLNSIIYDKEIELLDNILNKVKEAKIDAVIAHDFAVLNKAIEKDINIHISTQANVSNIEAVKFYSKFSSTIVLARELSADQIKNITDTINEKNILGPQKQKVKIEIFIHGALCVSISGKCFMSLAQYNKSANRGECLQACRRKYKVEELETGKELIIENNYIMSPKDLCTILHLDKILNTGAEILKIEGRARSPEYVYTVTKAYKNALNAIENNCYTDELKESLLNEVKRVYNRDFWHGGYYLGEETKMWANSHGSKATTKKIYIGKSTNYFSKIKVGEFLLHSAEVKKGDKVLISGLTTGIFELRIDELNNNREIAYKGEKISFKVDRKIRKGDKLYLIEESNA